VEAPLNIPVSRLQDAMNEGASALEGLQSVQFDCSQAAPEVLSVSCSISVALEKNATSHHLKFCVSESDCALIRPGRAYFGPPPVAANYSSVRLRKGNGCRSDNDRPLPGIPSVAMSIRGGCTFSQKARMAESMGFKSIVVVDSNPVDGNADSAAFSMAGDEGKHPGIPAYFAYEQSICLGIGLKFPCFKSIKWPSVTMEVRQEPADESVYSSQISSLLSNVLMGDGG